MKQQFFIASLFLLMLSCINAISASAQVRNEKRINIQHVGHSHDHFDHPVLADQPDVYYDDDNFQIIIDGGGEVAYYDVEITSMTTWYVVISTVVSGTYDTIDVSTLATGDYIITISSPTGNEFEGEFTIN